MQPRKLANQELIWRLRLRHASASLYNPHSNDCKSLASFIPPHLIVELSSTLPSSCYKSAQMAACKYCNNLEIPSYQTVVQSRPPSEYARFSAIPSTEPRGIKPSMTITIDAILSGVGIPQCATCIMLRNALLAISNKALDEMREIECMGGGISGTLNVKIILSSGFEERFEFYTLAGQLPFQFMYFERLMKNIS